MLRNPGGGGGLAVGTSPITGGSDTQVLFNDGGTLGGSAGLVFAKGNHGTTSQLTIGGNARLLGEAANTLALRNATTGQNVRIYETFTDASNYSRVSLRFDTSDSRYYLVQESAGTGTARLFEIGTLGASAVGFRTNNTSRWQVDSSGNFIAATDATYDIGAAGATRPRSIYASTTIQANSQVIAGEVHVSTTSLVKLSSPSDGVLKLGNNANSDFGRLQFGGTTSSFPSLKRSSTVLQARLADDSAFAPLQGALRTAANATTGLTGGVLAATTNASIVITDASGQDYRVPCII